MKRFFRFLFLVLLLALAVASWRVWSARRTGIDPGGRHSVFGWLDGGGRRQPEKYTVAAGPRLDVKDVNVLAAMSQQRVLLAKAVVPSVVSIKTSKNVPALADRSDPFAFFHRDLRRGGGHLASPTQLGSGAIVSREGHIVTNNHVIEGMDRFEVELSDGRRRPARLVGTDPETDIAVLKIEAGDLQPLPFADSDLVEVGETVMAVGNPFGLEESVSQGIVSAKGRHDSEHTYDLFQTDAQVNPGNSGGPLINVRGELIGINEAIATETGEFMGVSFAIPSDTVRRTMDNLLKLGHAVHGYLGIQQRPLDPDTASEKGISGAKGVVVDSIVPGSPAEKAALRTGDVIEKFNGHAVRDFYDLRRGVADVDVDSTVPVEVVRDGRTLSVQARITERPAADTQLSALPHGPRRLPGGTDAGMFGAVRMRDLTPPDLGKLDLPAGTRGVLVVEVGADSPAADQLRPGDVIEQVNQQPVASIRDIGQHLRALPEGHPVSLSVWRDRARVRVDINPG